MRALHLAGLSSLAVAQPLFDLLGRNAEFFAVRDVTRWDIVLFAVAVVVVPPAFLVAVEALAAIASARFAAVVHLGAVAFLVALIALQAAVRVADASAWLLVPVAAAVGAAAAAAYARFPPVRSLATVLAAAPVLFLCVFLFGSAAAKLILPREAEALAAEVSSDVPVVMLVFDEISTMSLLDADSRIDADRFPNFAALADDATWFRNAATVDAWTVNAVPAVLTGVYPEHGRLPVYSEHPNNLFTLLRTRYRLHVSESLTELCPAELCPQTRAPFGRRMRSLGEDAGVLYLHGALPRELRSALPPVSDTWGEFLDSSHERTSRRLTLYRDFLAALEPGSRPLLAYAHVMFPHIPWEYLPSGRRYRADIGDVPGFEATRWGGDRYLVEQAYQRYLLQLGFADRLLGELVRRLRATRLYDRALVIVLADHGVSFRPADRRRAFTDTNLEDVVFMPLFVKTPAQSHGRIDDTPVQTVDVLPTIADVLEVAVPWHVDGASLLMPRARERYVLVGDEGSLSVTPASLEERRRAALERQLELFGEGWRGVYAFGPNRGLIGRRPGDLTIASPTGATAEIDQEDEFDDVDASAEYVPARVTGRIVGGDSPAPRELAVAVNGRIVAVGRSYVSDGEERVSILIPEAALRSGSNAVELFAVGSGPVLQPLWSS